MSITAELLAEIEGFLIRHDMAATTFGTRACKDPHIVRILRKGGPLTSTRIDKCRAFMRLEDAKLQRDWKPRPKPKPEEAAA